MVTILAVLCNAIEIVIGVYATKISLVVKKVNNVHS